MEHIRFMCSIRICRALVDKYKHDPRHRIMQEKFVWNTKKWNGFHALVNLKKNCKKLRQNDRLSFVNRMNIQKMKLLLLLVSTCNAFNNSGPFSASWIQEAEKKHSRAALVALPTLISLSSVTDASSVSWLSEQPVEFQATAFAFAGFLEAFNLRRLESGFSLKPEKTPGAVPTFHVWPSYLNTIEDCMGRVAMILTFVMLIPSINALLGIAS